MITGKAKLIAQLGYPTVLVLGAGGMGPAIAASLARTGVAHLGLFDAHGQMTEALAGRLRRGVIPRSGRQRGRAIPPPVTFGSTRRRSAMKAGDPVPVDVDRIDLAPSSARW